ncbi:MAG: hypothetical protein ACFB14_07225 [Leptolyngbyaceae cyanobacterium]
MTYMWILSTMLEGGSIEDAIVQSLLMKDKRPSYFPPQGFVLTMLERISQATSELEGAIDVCVVEGGRAS